jgi:hypothetical protein
MGNGIGSEPLENVRLKLVGNTLNILLNQNEPLFLAFTEMAPTQVLFVGVSVPSVSPCILMT